MEEDIQNYSTTVMICGTPCSRIYCVERGKQRIYQQKSNNVDVE